MNLPDFGQNMRHDKLTHYHELTDDHNTTKERILTINYTGEEAQGQNDKADEMTTPIKVTLIEEEALGKMQALH